MKAIAVVTMTFLPATFVLVSYLTLMHVEAPYLTNLSSQSIFSTSFFHSEPSAGGMKESFVVSDKFWMYWVFAAPLSVVALGLWIFWDGMLGKKHFGCRCNKV
jgi:hypothetical protein